MKSDLDRHDKFSGKKQWESLDKLLQRYIAIEIKGYRRKGLNDEDIAGHVAKQYAMDYYEALYIVRNIFPAKRNPKHRSTKDNYQLQRMHKALITAFKQIEKPIRTLEKANIDKFANELYVVRAELHAAIARSEKFMKKAGIKVRRKRK